MTVWVWLLAGMRSVPTLETLVAQKMCCLMHCLLCCVGFSKVSENKEKGV